jgi:hypothetical protein
MSFRRFLVKSMFGEESTSAVVGCEHTNVAEAWS